MESSLIKLTQSHITESHCVLNILWIMQWLIIRKMMGSLAMKKQRGRKPRGRKKAPCPGAGFDCLGPMEVFYITWHLGVGFFEGRSIGEGGHKVLDVIEKKETLYCERDCLCIEINLIIEFFVA